ncbi:MAG: response regulator [Lachnospiraceae bacterium]|nr:response regulator [Lachnospiraceae bacterium]
MDYELQLTDLIDKETLQKIQDGFSNMTGIAALTTDADGIPVTEGSNFSEFCMKYTRSTEKGCKSCIECDKWGAELAMKKGKAAVYFCHADLVEFSAPIVADGRLMGCFLGGQVLTKEADPEKIRKVAARIGVDPEEYVEASKKIRIIDRETVDNAAKFLHMIASVLSDMAYNKYLVYRANKELEKSGNMKSDFLANMSHEIRTPMNAVIGMAEMALREELPPVAREYINQIKEAGRSLLTIINDILDFTKIESGRMDVNEVKYEPMSIVYDVANIVMTRLKEKDVELILDVSPDLPSELYGDSIRIKQVLLNLLNNAAKFTARGRITMKMNYVETAPDEIEMRISVEDTGIGIKKEDISKLFQSFQQVDSKRNRNIEGTGLGLAISKRLLSLMNGDIWVESEYEKGSKFSCALPQKVINKAPSITIQDADSLLAGVLVSNPYIRESLCSDVADLGVDYILKDSKDFHTFPEGKKIFLFIEYSLFSGKVEAFVRQNPQITAVLLIEFYDSVDYNIPNLLVVRKPLFALTIAMILNGEELHFDDDTDKKEFDFIAPDANVLIVDDNAVNLTVAEGIMEPLKMKIDTVTSGKAAVDKISRFHYDIVFMDHMMPELDGVETTHIIRRFHPEYDDVPIIALTANAVEGTKEMFCREGMNDFIPKPIELRLLASKVKQWIPIEKVQKIHHTRNIDKGEKKSDHIVVGDLDIKYAMEFLVSEELFWKVLKVYYHSIDKKAKLIKELEEAENWTEYTIEVHALKNSSKQIGAMMLSERAAAMEKAGNARDALSIHRHTDKMLEQYMGYRSILEPFCADSAKGDAGKEKVPAEAVQNCFGRMRGAVDDLDMDGMEEVIQEMDQYRYEGWQKEMFARLKEAVEEIDVDSCEAIMIEWEGKLEDGDGN